MGREGLLKDLHELETFKKYLKDRLDENIKITEYVDKQIQDMKVRLQ